MSFSRSVSVWDGFMETVFLPDECSWEVFGLMASNCQGQRVTGFPARHHNYFGIPFERFWDTFQNTPPWRCDSIYSRYEVETGLDNYGMISFLCLFNIETSAGLLSLQKRPKQNKPQKCWYGRVSRWFCHSSIIIQQFFFEIKKPEYIYTYYVEQGRRYLQTVVSEVNVFHDPSILACLKKEKSWNVPFKKCCYKKKKGRGGGGEVLTPEALSQQSFSRMSGKSLILLGWFPKYFRWPLPQAWTS